MLTQTADLEEGPVVYVEYQFPVSQGQDQR